MVKTRYWSGEGEGLRQDGKYRLNKVVVGLLAMVFLSCVPMRAQIGFYAQATGANLRFPTTSHIYGGTFGFYDIKQVGHILIGPDLRGALLSRGSSHGQFNDQALDMGQVGLRVAAAPGVIPGAHSLIPYAEVATGLGYWRGGVSPNRQDANHFMVQAIAGLDYRIKSAIDWRIAELSYGRAGAAPGYIHPVTASMGMVLWFH